MKTSKLTRPALGVALVSLLSACASPLERSSQDQLRDQMIAHNRAQLQAAPETSITVVRRPSDVELALTKERMEELDLLSGPKAYREAKPDLGADLAGQMTTPTQNVVRIGLQECIHLAVKNNLEIRQGRLLPAISQTQITQAEAVFDAIFFANFDFQNLDTPRPPTASSSAFPGPNPASSFGGPQQTETNKLATGIRKTLSTGGQITVQTEFSRNWADPTLFTDKNYYNSDVSVAITQPLLRNFGAQYAKAQISLSKNARDQSNEDLRKVLIDVANGTERAYWDMAFALNRLFIQTRLLERTIEDRDRVQKRKDFDVKPATLTDIDARVEARRADLIRARQFVRQSSDSLKRLLNSPDMPITGEVLIIPIDAPAELPINFSLLDSVTQAMRRRPDLIKALSQIDDASIRQRVADNGRLPELNVAASIRYNGLGKDVADSYNNLGEGAFIDYLFGVQFEAPIGNRAAEALYQQRALERQALVVAYQRTMQDAILEIKNNLRDLNSAFELIGANRSARRAAADNLRALNVEEQAGAALTPEFFDLKLRREEALAQAEVDEVQALVTYNTIIPKLYQSTGTLLEKNGIDFSPDEPNQTRHDTAAPSKLAPAPATATTPAKK